MKKIALLGIVVLYGAIFLAGFYQDNSSIGVLNLLECWNNYDKVKDLKKTIEERQKIMEIELQKKAQDLKDAEEKYKSAPDDSSLKLDKFEEYSNALQAAKAKKERLERELAKLVQDYKEDVIRDINAAAEATAKELNLKLLLKGEVSWEEEAEGSKALDLKIQTRIVMYYDRALDITSMVVSKLNNEYKKKKAAGD